MRVETTKSEAKWEAESDASTLASAEAIKRDPKKLAKARIAARRLSKEKTDEAIGMAKISGKNMDQYIKNIKSKVK